jgi:Endonuclease/Exonuclease/phosphatase family
MRPAAAAVLALAIVAAVAGWSVADARADARPTRAAALGADGTIRLSVMTFNIRQGGVHGPWRQTVRAVRAAGADVVGLQEPFGRTRKLARWLGWYAAPRLHTISRFPIVEPAGSHGRWGWLLVAPGKVVTIANIHNPSWPYSVDLLRTGSATRQDVMRIERHYRLRWMRPFLDALVPQIAAGAPVFFTGDFNAPSWRDWTREVVRAQGWQPPTVRASARRIPIRWPTSVKMEASGFRDSYREVHPDAIAEPGFTWTSGHPGVSPWDVFDRIDFVWAAGPAVTLGSRVVGDDDPMSDVVVEPWPSDHRAVVSRFRVTPADAPGFVAPVDVRVRIGRPARIAFEDPPAPGRTLGLWPVSSDVGTDPPVATAPIPDAAARGRIRIATDGLAPGPYRTALTRTAGPPVVGATAALVEPGAPPTIAVSARRFDVGEPIVVTWTNAPGNRYDWLDVHAADATPTTGRIWNWRYIGGRVFGTAPIKAEATGNWPLPPGRYRVSLCVDDDYVCVATTRAFTIVGT